MEKSDKSRDTNFPETDSRRVRLSNEGYSSGNCQVPRLKKNICLFYNSPRGCKFKESDCAHLHQKAALSELYRPPCYYMMNMGCCRDTECLFSHDIENPKVSQEDNIMKLSFRDIVAGKKTIAFAQTSSDTNKSVQSSPLKIELSPDSEPKEIKPEKADTLPRKDSWYEIVEKDSPRRDLEINDEVNKLFESLSLIEERLKVIKISDQKLFLVELMNHLNMIWKIVTEK